MTASAPIQSAPHSDARAAMSSIPDVAIAARHHDLSIGNVAILAYLADAPASPKMSDLAECMGFRAPSATQIIDRLERLRLVARKPFPGDRRAWIVSITDKGREILAAITETIATMLESRA